MMYLSYSSVIDQSLRKFKRASHALSFLSLKTTIPFRRIGRLNARQTVKLAKQLGWNPDVNWRDYPCQWHRRPTYDLETCLCEHGHGSTPKGESDE